MTDQPQPVALVTGPSGAGRSTALRALEDFGFEVIDNLPLSLMPRLLDGRPTDRPLALSIDARNRDFAPEALTATLDQLACHTPKLLYLDCRPDVLLRRFSETRRSHPYSDEGALPDAIDRERTLLEPLKDRADIILDTSDMSPHELRAALTRWFAPTDSPLLHISIDSFSYKRGLPQDLDTVFDVRFLANPHWEPDLRPLDGRNPRVASHVEADPRFPAFFSRVSDLVLSLLPAYLAEGKTHLGIGFGCTGGRHRSVAVAEKLAKTLADAGWQVSIRHREQDKGEAS
ncbi:MAG: RNase adapter RapZ [Pseudomonadota bacterium]